MLVVVVLSFLVFGAGVLGLAGFIAFRATRGLRAQWRRHRRNRRASPRAWADHRQWTYTSEVPHPPFSSALAISYPRGAKRYTEVIEGTVRGVPAASWIQTEWRSDTPHRGGFSRQRVAALHVPWSVPRISLTPSVDELSHSVNSSVNAATRVVLEGDRFNRAWFVSSDDPRTASTVLHPRTMERLLLPDALPAAGAQLSHEKTHVRFIGRHLYAWRPYRTDVNHLDDLFRLLGDLYDLTPDHVRQDRGPDDRP